MITLSPFTRAVLALVDAGGNVLLYGGCNEVRWPSGQRETFADDEVCRVAIEAYLRRRRAPVQLDLWQEAA